MAIGRVPGAALLPDLDRQGLDLQFTTSGNPLLYMDFAQFRVGVNATQVQTTDTFTVNGNIASAGLRLHESNLSVVSSSTDLNLTSTANIVLRPESYVDLGSAGNLRIYGGQPNYVLSTDGDGNISWNEVSNLDIQFGNLQLDGNTVKIVGIEGNLYLQANSGSVVTANVFYASEIVTGNITGVITTPDQPYITSLGNIGNLTVVDTLTVNGQIIANVSGNATGINATYTGNVTSGNLIADTYYGNVIGTYSIFSSNVDAGNVNSTFYGTLHGDVYADTVTATTFVGTLSTSNQPNITSVGSLVSLDVLGNITAGNVESTFYGNLYGNVSGTQADFTGNVTAEGLIGSLYGDVNSTTANISGNVYAGNVEATAFYGNTVGTTAWYSDTVHTGNLVVHNVISTSSGNLVLTADPNDPTTVVTVAGTSALEIPYGDISQRPANPGIGYIRYNTELDSVEFWTGLSWVTTTQNISTEVIAPNGSDVTYTLNQSTTAAGILVTINGTLQNPTPPYAAYSVSGNQITFAETPLVTDIIEIRYIASGVAQAQFYGGDILGNVAIRNSTPSTSVDTGALIVEGGLGIAGNINISGNLYSSGIIYGTVVGSISTTNGIDATDIGANIPATGAFTTLSTTNDFTVGGNIIPTANITYDLGSSDYRFKDLWLSGTTIHLGSASLSSDAGVINLPAGSTVGGANVDVTSINANIEAANAAIITANTSMKSYVDAVSTAWTSNAASQQQEIHTLQTEVYSNVNAAAYLGGTITVGTISSGTWNGTAVGLNYGGTGATSAAGALTNLLPTGTNAGYVLTTSGPGSFYWAAVSGGTNQGTKVNTSRTFYTATAGQTLFENVGTYTPGAGQLRVYQNGVRQFDSEYTESSTTSFTLTTGATDGDLIMAEVDSYIEYTTYANAVVYNPTGSISTSANTVQLAIDNLESRKATTDSPTFTGTVSAGNITVTSNVAIGSVLQRAISGTVTTSSSPVEIDRFSATAYRSGKYEIQVTNSTTNEYQSSEVRFIHDGTTVSQFDYGIAFTGNVPFITYDATIVSGNVVVTANTVATGQSLTVKGIVLLTGI